MKTVKRKIAILILLVTATFHIFPTAVWANSAIKEWSGSDASGVSVMEKSCPVTVKNEKLTFDIPMFPDYYYGNSEDFVEYRASVTARYEFYNPKDYDVTATLAFPFGVTPEYASTDSENGLSITDLERYGVKLDGEAVPTLSLRHTYFQRYGETFETTEHLARLRDGYATEGILNKDTTVTAYNYKVSGTKSSCSASISVDGIGEERFIVSYYGYYSVHEDEIKLGIDVDERAAKDSFTVYCIGKPLDDTVNPVLFTNSRENQTAEGTVTLKSTEQMTLCEFAMTNYSPESGVSETDRFNAVVDCIRSNWEKLGRIIGDWDVFNVEDSLMRWYMYEMTVPAGETVINDVTAPLYPDIDDGFVPSLYTYNYLLSPARSWAGFGKLDIEIITPYYLIECDIFPEFEKTESGYATSLNGLPSGELRFTLSSDPSPKREITPYTFLGIGLYAVIIGVTVALPAAAIITVTVIIVKKHRKTR